MQNENRAGIKVKFLVSYEEICTFLERAGIRNFHEKKLWPTCYAYQREDGNYIAHFKELLRDPQMKDFDYERRNSIIWVMFKRGLIDIEENIQNKIKRNRAKKRICILDEEQIENDNWEIINKIHSNTLHYHINRE